MIYVMVTPLKSSTGALGQQPYYSGPPKLVNTSACDLDTPWVAGGSNLD